MLIRYIINNHHSVAISMEVHFQRVMFEQVMNIGEGTRERTQFAKPETNEPVKLHGRRSSKMMRTAWPVYFRSPFTLLRTAA